jgi:hypothetical protein
MRKTWLFWQREDRGEGAPPTFPDGPSRTFIANNYAPFYTVPIECTERDAPYVLDGLLYHGLTGGNVRRDAICSETCRKALSIKEIRPVACYRIFPPVRPLCGPRHMAIWV